MQDLGRNIHFIVILPIALGLAAAGCATKKYARKQVAPVNQRLAQYEAVNNDRVAYLHHKEQRDIATVNGRIDTTDRRVDHVAQNAQEAHNAASRAQESARRAMAQANADRSATARYSSRHSRGPLGQTAIMFAPGQSTLTTAAKAELDRVAARAHCMRRAEVQIVGYEAPTGAGTDDVALSRQRAAAVERYLKAHNVRMVSIHLVGLSAARPMQACRTSAELNRLSRRVDIRVFGTGVTTGSAARSAE